MNKKGISLVALVITIIVLIILTGAVVITGVNVPQGGQQAVTDYNFGMVQDAVTLFIMNEISKAPTSTVADAMNKIATFTEAGEGDAKTYTFSAWKADANDATKDAKSLLNLSGVDLSKYTVSISGLVADAQ